MTAVLDSTSPVAPALWRAPGLGALFTASTTARLANEAARVAMVLLVLDRTGPQAYFRPHPYAPELRGVLPFHVADDPAYDAQFPEHPLSRVRQVMAQLAAQVTLDPAFAALPPFAPHGTSPATDGR